MKELSDNHIENIISLLEKGKPLPEHYKDALISDLKKLKTSLLFDTKKEYELIYAGKEREEDTRFSPASPLNLKTFFLRERRFSRQRLEFPRHWCGNSHYLGLIVIEIKDDKAYEGTAGDENKKKLEYAREHFDRLNKLQKVQKYYFKFLSPISYDLFFKALRENNYQDFKSEIEARLEG
ncbi:MAG: hypothetical protein ACK415_00175 [Thermodesulfovibrionales bacterium]